MTNTRLHLARVLDRVTAVFADEVRNCTSLAKLYPNIGELHPAICREGHGQSLLFAGLRASGYYTMAEGSYFKPVSNSRQIDLAVWLPDVLRWLYLEVKPCSPYRGDQPVLDDADKLVCDRATDCPADDPDRLRGVLAYGFREHVTRDSFLRKYKQLSARLTAKGFEEIGIEQRSLDGTEYKYVQAGLWVLGLG